VKYNRTRRWTVEVLSIAEAVARMPSAPSCTGYLLRGHRTNFLVVNDSPPGEAGEWAVLELELHQAQIVLGVLEEDDTLQVQVCPRVVAVGSPSEELLLTIGDLFHGVGARDLGRNAVRLENRWFHVGNPRECC